MCKVLVVDNDLLVQKAMKKMIEAKQGFSVLDTLQSGEEALDFCRQQSPDIIFMDIFLPGMNGLETARHIKEISHSIDICFISAYQNIEFVKEALKLDIKEYLTKPVSMQSIWNILEGYKPSVTVFEVSDITDQIARIINEKDFHLVYEQSRNIAEAIFQKTERDKPSIAEIMHSIAKFIQNQYLEDPYEQSHIEERFPINEKLLEDEIVVEMWIAKVLDYVYKYRFVTRFASAKPVFDYIDEHIKEYISMLSIIENCHISQQYILRLFKEQMKMSTLDYIQNRKIMLAKWYFYLGEYSTLDVAVMLGYGDAGYFSKIFKKYESVTAFQYKSNLEAAKKNKIG